ncbi:uncharacterized protein [Drosophila kikkawai]|uniref:Endonuclease/exonuclease/phosphatase domain-containing protein n=1 Tax=Drosophila kikkawai TaxID=30033 RepID=A0ABM4GGM5_DROKI
MDKGRTNLWHGHKGIHNIILKLDSNLDLAVERFKAADGTAILIASGYMAHDEPAPPKAFNRVMQWAEETKTTLILGCYANARHTLWGSRETNERGESLFDSIICRDVTICNKGNTPTFIFPSTEGFQGWEEVLDITLQMEHSDYKVRNWRVSTQDSFSGHRYIYFQIAMPICETAPKRNPRNTDWDKYGKVVQSKVKDRKIKTRSTPERIDKEVEDFTNILNKAYTESCRLTYSKKTYPPWWNKELCELRKKVRKAFNTSYGTKDWQPYKAIHKEYKKAIYVAKKESWSSYCESLEGVKDTTRK